MEHRLSPTVASTQWWGLIYTICNFIFVANVDWFLLQQHHYTMTVWYYFMYDIINNLLLLLEASHVVQASDQVL